MIHLYGYEKKESHLYMFVAAQIGYWRAITPATIVVMGINHAQLSLLLPSIQYYKFQIRDPGCGILGLHAPWTKGPPFSMLPDPPTYA